MIYERICKRCGKTISFLSITLYSYKIGEDFFCGYTCHNAELTEKEEKKRKMQEEAAERRRFYQKQRNIARYQYYKYNMNPEPEHVKNFRAVVKCTQDGEIVAHYDSVLDAAKTEGVTAQAVYRWISRKYKRKKEFLWRYE